MKTGAEIVSARLEAAQEQLGDRPAPDQRPIRAGIAQESRWIPAGFVPDSCRVAARSADENQTKPF
jgi:hypothetical protein